MLSLLDPLCLKRKRDGRPSNGHYLQHQWPYSKLARRDFKALPLFLVKKKGVGRSASEQRVDCLISYARLSACAAREI
jgi:hypothetical protein